MKRLLTLFIVATVVACLALAGCGALPFGGSSSSRTSSSASLSSSAVESSSASSSSSGSSTADLPVANDLVQVSGTTTMSEPKGNLALSIRVKGLMGGSADADMAKERANAIVVVASILQDYENRGLAYELASLSGGTAANAIPSEASAVIVVDVGARSSFETTANAYINGLKNTFSGIENSITLEIAETGMPAEVASNDDRRNALWFMTEIIDGVNTWQRGSKEQVESSSNLGVFSLNSGGVTATTSVHSTSADREAEIVNKQVALAGESGYKAEVIKLSEL